MTGPPQQNHDGTPSVGAEQPPDEGESRFESLRGGLEDQLRRERFLRNDLEKAVRLLTTSLAAFELETLAAAREEIQRMLQTPVPVKHQIRAIESEEVRKALNRAFLLQREERLDAALARTDVDWDAPITRDLDVGVGFDERAVEIPLALRLLCTDQPGRALDAGASLNLPAAQRILAGSPVTVVHLTQSGERETPRFDGSRLSYMFGDLRDLPFRDEWFDRIACVSTLEHVGMDNSRYGGPVEDDPTSHLDVVSELLRVLAPGGQLFLSFPAGIGRRLGWFQIFGPEEVSAIIARFGSVHAGLRYFTYEGSWIEVDGQRVTEEDDPETEIVRSIAVINAVKELE